MNDNVIWLPIETAPKNRDVMLRGWYEPSPLAASNGAEPGYVFGHGRWLFGETWSGILGSKPTHWADGVAR